VPQWLKNLTMLVVLLTWLAVVAVTLYQGKLPDAPVLGIPAAVVLALAPPGALSLRRNRNRSQGDTPDEESA
jgi:hypothetical protein